jgi:glycosyltransferase involved in cell wall biosynthesis
MHLVLISHAYDSAASDPAGMLERFSSLTGWVEAIAARGWRVSVVQRFRHDAHFVRNGIDYYFVGDSLPAIARLWQIPTALHRKAVELKGDIVHLNGLLFPLQLYHLARSLPETPIIVQHHAERPWRGWRKFVQKFGLAHAAGFLFVSQEQAQLYREEALIADAQPVFEVMEGSTTFEPQVRQHSRRITGLSGTPQFLWIGRLIPLKNPLVVLQGFAEIVERHSTARLAMIYHDAPLLAEVKAMIKRIPALQRTVRRRWPAAWSRWLLTLLRFAR